MNEFEFDLFEFFSVVKRHLIFILVVTILTTLLSGIYTVFFVEDKYHSSATLFPQLVVSDEMIDYEQLTANSAMLNTYVELIKSGDVISKVSQRLKVDYSTVANSLAVWKHANTQLITVQSTTPDPTLSKDIVENILEVFYEDIARKIEVTNIITVSEPKVSTTPISANIGKNLCIGALGGILLSVGLVFLQFITDNRIHNKAEAEKYFNLPVLGVIPDMENINELH